MSATVPVSVAFELERECRALREEIEQSRRDFARLREILHRHRSCPIECALWTDLREVLHDQ